jgi:hypothetical protein
MKVAVVLLSAAVIGAGGVVIYHRLTTRDASPAPGPGTEPEHTTAHTHA